MSFMLITCIQNRVLGPGGPVSGSGAWDAWKNWNRKF